MQWIDNILFFIITGFAFGVFATQMQKVLANIRSGRPDERADNPAVRFNKMLLVAFGQQKMFQKPLPAILHLFVYVGFLVINIEVLEILIDGIFGTHRVLSFMGPVYDLLMGVNEVLGFIVIIVCVILLWRRNVMKIRRFSGIEMKHTSFVDANIILVTEIVLMMALYLFNASDLKQASLSGEELPGVFPVSSILSGILGSNVILLEFMKNLGWWAHIIGIYAFLNYLPISKHFHIMMAFPNVYFSKLTPSGKFNTMEQIYHEVKAAFDPSYAVPVMENAPKRFGAMDVSDLSWKNLMDAYTCTECGRCTDVCPANQTGKKLSPRKIVMDTRDRMEEIQKNGLRLDENGLYTAPNGASEATAHTLLGDYYISTEELWACTTCNACTEACPVNIDHVSTILDLRRFLVMEESKIPESWARMFTNIENNGAPWAISAASRFDWAMDIPMPEN
ncbi:MAG: 4Fe-4S dicluster domain-containing protein [Bacteroidia bacterium]|nr:4Fe-4S dicluster domain-containing protein [Bacteroidia bacterium]